MSEALESAEVIETQVLRRLRPPYEAVMLFGSVARQMPSRESDRDVLQLVAEPRSSYKEGQLSVSVYSSAALEEMATQGNLFVLHLKLEGRIILIRVDCSRDVWVTTVKCRVMIHFSVSWRVCSNFLDVPHAEYVARPGPFNQMAVFILRSTLFAILAAKGHPLFAMERVAGAFGDPEILQVYSLKRLFEPRRESFEKAKGLIERYLKCRIRNPFGSYEALLLNSSRESPFVTAVALHFLKRVVGEEAYGFWARQLDESKDHHR